MAVQRCAVVPAGGGRVQNIILADPDKDQPYKGTMFVPVAVDERCDQRFEYWGEVALGFRFRPAKDFEAEYFNEWRALGSEAALAAAKRSARTTTDQIAASYGCVDGMPEKTAFDEGVALVTANG